MQALITTDYVLILNAEEEIVLGFIEELQRRLVPKPLGIHRNAASSPELSGAFSIFWVVSGFVADSVVVFFSACVAVTVGH